MKLFRAVCLSVMFFAVPALGQSAPEFTPREPLRKRAVLTKPDLPTGRLIVKFKDDVQARLRAGKVRSNVGADLADVAALSQQLNADFKPLFGDKTEMALRLVEIRAAAYSGKAQPDLAGMMYVDGPQDQLDAIAERLHAMNIVEFVEYDQHYVTKGGDPACGDTTNDCFDASMNAGPFCGADPNDTTCCNLICQIRPFCCDEAVGEWDLICADLANLFCECAPPCHGAPPDRCNAPILGGGCFEIHPFGGCSDGDCCTIVCGLDPFCCVAVWDELCVGIAAESCQINDPGPTPDFTESNPIASMRRQKYRTVGASADFFAQTGYSGQGFDLQGLWNLGETLLGLGVGDQNMTHGLGRRVAIIEHSASVPIAIATGHAQNDPGHEDLASVICEPNQTPIPINLGNVSSNHGTACLGVAVADENGFGVTGIARHAQGYFFPIVSQEAGGRIQAAILSCIETFEAGDVMSFSIGPGGCGILVSSEAIWTLVRLASDLGITACIAAGNDCCNLDDAGQFGAEDSGAIIVGACWPGAINAVGVPPHYCRLGFSNFCQDCDDGDGIVHCAAWGTAVTTCGYGDLHGGFNDLNGQYTSVFNGTSAACPQIAALIACLQGLSVQFHGVTLTPEQVRSTLELKTQCSVPPDVVENAPGSSQDPPCGGDFDFDEDPNVIMGYPDVIATAVNVFASTFFDAAPGVQDITVVWGTKIFGNIFSIKGFDNNYFVIESVRRFGGNGTSPGGQALTYLGNGQITDVIVGAKSLNPHPNSEVGVTGQLVLQSSGPVMLLIEFFNWRTGKFDRGGFALFTDSIGGGFAGAPFPSSLPGSYIQDNTGRIEVRLTTLGFTVTPYRILYDLVDLFGTSDIVPNPIGDGGFGNTGGTGGTGGGGHGGSGGTGSGGSGGTGHGGLGGH
jgi:hypothetical protein